MHTSTQRLRPQPSRCSVQRMSPQAFSGVHEGEACVGSCTTQPAAHQQHRKRWVLVYSADLQAILDTWFERQA